MLVLPRPRIGLVVVGALTASITAGFVPAAASADPASVGSTSRNQASVVSGTNAVLKTPAQPSSSRSVQTRAVVWSGTHTVRLAASTGQWIGTGLEGVSASRHAKSAANLVTVAPLSSAERAQRGLAGPAFRVTRADGRPGTPGVDLKVDAETLNSVYGGNYASRVRWVAVADSPVPLGKVSAPTALANAGPALATKSSVIMTALSAPAAANGTGDYSATSLAPAASWQVSAQTGAFQWNYPFRVPPVAGNLTPQVGLSYNSGSVDGETGSTNNQPSAVGDGWSLTGGGYVERSYQPCNQDGVSTSSDLCWKSDNATLNLDGQAEHLVKDSSGIWHLENDDGSKIEKLTGATNGDTGTAGVDGVGEYWRLTTTDGTQYYFGLNHLPGWVTGNATTNSTFTVPVFGNNTGEPCYNATFASASCVQAWRWNLDYIVTPHGDSQSRWYSPETNMYLRNNTTLVTYIRGGQLNQVQYGSLNGSAITTTVPARLWFELADRCKNTAAACDSAHASNAPDIPWDQQCNSAATCAGHPSPTFFTQKMITKIHAQTQVSGTTFADVDLWTLNHSFPDPGDTTSASLWLASITHSGTSTAASVPDVVFTGASMQGRIFVVDGSALQFRYRITGIDSESGAHTAVVYSTQQCSGAAPGGVPFPETNDQRCFPQWWAPPGFADQLDWFNKYVVTSVGVNPATGNSPVDTTFYDYVGTPAWRYDRSPFVPASRKTWAEFAGYSQVRVRHGSETTPAGQETTTYTYFQGMDGDRLNTGGGTKPRSVSASDGTTVTDSLWFAGKVLETLVSNGNSGPRSAPVNGARVANTITVPTATLTASDSFYASYMASTVDTVTHTALSAGGNRNTEKVTTYDSHARVHTVNDLADTSTAADDQCSTTDYVTGTANWLLDYPSEVAVVAKACGTPPTYPADAISDSRTYYDGSTTLGAIGATGNATRSDVVDSYTGSTPHWQTVATTTYDSLGRPLVVTDPRVVPSRTNKMAYVPAGVGLPTQTTTTNAMNWNTVTTLDPRWGVTTKTTDPNNNVLEMTYDGLGRRSQVWLPERPKASNATPSVSYAYTVSATGANSVATTNLLPAGGTSVRYNLYDGLLRPTQTQAPAEGGGRDLTDTIYDEAGRTATADSLYWTSGTPSSTPFTPVTSLPGQIKTGYDGAGRKTYEAQWILNAEVWRTSYAYGGDHSDTTPPNGGTASTTWTDARGHTTKLAQYHASTPTGPSDNTTYTYWPNEQLKTMTDPGGNAWSWTYDMLGNKLTTHDPDAGNSSSTYDAAGRLSTTTDADSHTVAFAYDNLDRTTATYIGTTSGTQLTGYTYDTLTGGTVVKGLAATSTRYVGGTAFATSSVISYDAANRVTAQKMDIASGPFAGSYTTSMQYAPDGQLSFIGHSAAAGLGGDGISYTFDSLGNLATATGPSAVTYVSATTYNSIGQPTKYQNASGPISITRQLGYQDGTGRVLTDQTTTLGTSNPVITSHTFTYNDAGQVVKDVNAVAAVGTDTQCYNYDYLQHLTQVWTPTSGDCTAAPSSASLAGPAPYWQSYTYDTVGNRTSIIRHAITVGGTDATNTYTYPTSGTSSVRPHAVSSVTPNGVAPGTPGYTYGYTNNGSTNSRPAGQSYTYDAEGHLATATTAAGTTTYVYDAAGNRLIETNAAGSTFYSGDSEYHVASGSTTLTVVRTYSFKGIPVAERSTQAGVSGSKLVWLVPDRQGTAEAQVDPTTGAVARRHLDPFGASRDTGAVSWTSSHVFLNAPTNSDTGLTHLGARDYDPQLGRFTTVDPVLDPNKPSQNDGYSYAWNNPVNATDPSGTRPADPGGDEVPIYGKDYRDWIADKGNPTASKAGPAGNTGGAAADKNFTTRHNQAVAAAVVVISAQIIAMGGDPSTLDTSRSNSIAGGGHNGGDGYPDIVWTDPRTKLVYIWEVKIVGKTPQAVNHAQIYVDAFNRGKPFPVARLGWAIGGYYKVPVNGDVIAGLERGEIIYGPPPAGPYPQPVPADLPIPVHVPSQAPQPVPGAAPGPGGTVTPARPQGPSAPGPSFELPGWVQTVAVDGVLVIGGVTACATVGGCVPVIVGVGATIVATN
jgi:RHS repeat-associated protein